MGDTYSTVGGADGAVQQRLDDAAAESARADSAARVGDHKRARDLYHSAHQMVHSASTMHLGSRPETSVENRAGRDVMHTALAATMGAAQYHAEAPMQAGGMMTTTMTNGDGHCAECDEEEYAAHFGPTGKSVTDAPWKGDASRFTDEEYQMACAACEQGSGTVKQRCHLPHHEPGGAINRNGVHAAAARLNQTAASVRSAAASHLRSHYTKDLDEDPPDVLQGAASTNGAGYAHEMFQGTHSHPHSPYGSQGRDETHDHSHTHSGDNSHDHPHPQGLERAYTWAAAVADRPWRTEPSPHQAAFHDRLRETAASMVASAHAHRGTWQVRQDHDGWQVITAAGVAWSEAVPTYADALEIIGRALAEGDQGVLSQGWRSDMAYEGLSTGDGRLIKEGATSFRNTPMPYMLQTETNPGHMGAELAGFITAAGMVGKTATGSGNFLANDSGRQQVQILAAVNRYGVSIDVAEAEGQPVCAEHGESLDGCGMDCSWEMQFSKIVVMGLTGTPFPAFADAFIELATQPSPVAASAAPAADGWQPSEDDPFDVTDSLTAAGQVSLGRPPAEWFAMPELRPGDPRLVRQQSGAWACPLTVEAADPVTGLRRFYSHVADRLTCHTGIVDRCQLVPQNSPTGYAVFNKKPLMTAEGDTVRVGPITMGCGHAPTDRRLRLTVDQIQAHYDGGPGAVRMGWAHAGSDQYGPWVAGVIARNATDEQIEEFSMLSLSGDWREVYRGKPIEMVACLAGVFSPGFPLVAALVAAGLPTSSSVAQIPDEPVAEFAEDGRCVALIAAGVIRQPYPWERQIASLTRQVEDLRDQVGTLTLTVDPLRPMAAQALVAAAIGDQVITDEHADDGEPAS